MIEPGTRVWVVDPELGRASGVVLNALQPTDQMTKLWMVRLDGNGLCAPVPHNCLSPIDDRD